MGTLKSSWSFLLILGFILEVFWDPLWRQFCDLSVIWGTKVGDSFQVSFFDDLWMEMIPECWVCMCLNHSKTVVFKVFHFFHVFTNLVSRGRVLGVILESVGGLGGTFSHLLGLGESLEI